jgi:sortase A
VSRAEVTERRRRATHARRRTSPGLRLVGVLGELLITAGVIVALFVVWQVFWTDVTAGRAAESHIEAFEETLPESPERPGTPQTGEPPAETAPAEGEMFATMFVPTWGRDWRFGIAEGVGREDVLDAGYVGHYPDTQLPGAVGNFALAGHRQSYAKPFFGVDTLEVGDSVIVQTAQAWYVYKVTDSYVVRPSQTEVIAPNPGDPAAEATERTITLTTCHPLWSTRERWIIHGVLDHWIDPDDGRPAEMIEAGAS